MKSYPEKTVIESIPELTDIQKNQVAEKMKQLEKDGAPLHYFKEGESGDRLSKHHMVSLATNEILQDRKYYHAVAAVYDEIETESDRMDGISPTDCKDLTEYKNKLKEKKKYFDETEWVNAMKEKYSVITFPQLKEAMSVSE